MPDPTNIASRACPNCRANQARAAEAEDKLRRVVVIIDGERKTGRIVSLDLDLPTFLANRHKWFADTRALFEGWPK